MQIIVFQPKIQLDFIANSLMYFSGFRNPMFYRLIADYEISFTTGVHWIIHIAFRDLLHIAVSIHILA